MLEKLHITARQWLRLLKWTLYSLCFLVLLLTETVLLGDVHPLGLRLHLLPIYLICVSVKEGAERGGLFALLASLFYCLSGADFGSVGIAVLTALSVFSALACTHFLNNRLLPCLLCCFLSQLCSESVTFLFHLLFRSMEASRYFSVLLPGVLLSMLTAPLLYVLVKAISRIGGKYGP